MSYKIERINSGNYNLCERICADVIERSLTKISKYHALGTIKIDTTGKDIQTIAKEIKSL